jgi:hypothetical protein
VSYGGPVHTDVVVFAEVQELLPSELRAIVGDDGVWDPKAMDDRPVWFVANCATLCLRLVVRIEELTLGRKVRQSVAS